MSISSLLFLFIFLPFSLVVYYISSDSSKEFVLVAISILFYSLAGINFVFLFLLSLIVTVIIGRSIFYSKSNIVRQILLIMGIIYNAVILIYYKNIGHLLSTLFSLSVDSISADSIMLPVGLSFYSFKSISYLADVKKGEAVLDNSVIHDFLYLSFFSQIQSGPISRYNDLKKVNENIKDSFSDGVIRFMVGFNKKMLIANVLSKISNEIFCTPFENFSTSLAWLGAISFSLQLLFDFAGYSDMAIGISGMFGYYCPENFYYPYMTESVTRFWRRWHISLSEWFRDYVYIPLGGSRCNKRYRVYFNLLVVWILTGIWHGAYWNYVIWGLGYFIIISFEKITGLPNRFKSIISKTIYRILSLLFIVFQWVMFNSKGAVNGLRYIKRMLVYYSNDLANNRVFFLLNDYAFYILMAVVLCFPVVPWIRNKTQNNEAMAKLFDISVYSIVILSFVLSISFIVAGQNNPFVYANF